MIALAFLVQEKVATVGIELFVVVSYFLFVLFQSQYNASAVVLATIGIVLGLLHQIYMIWGEKFFDLFDDKRTNGIAIHPKTMIFERARDSENKLEGMGFEQVEHES
jgi:hypothetical protein